MQGGGWWWPDDRSVLVVVAVVGDWRRRRWLAVELADGHLLTARRVVAATGLVDELLSSTAPPSIGVGMWCIARSATALRSAIGRWCRSSPTRWACILPGRQLSERLTLVLHDGIEPGHGELAALRWRARTT